MLPLQKFLLEDGDVDSLYIKRHYGENLNLIGYKYSADSPKVHPAVINARGIVLTPDHQLVMKGFNRFFNYGQTFELEKTHRAGKSPLSQGLHEECKSAISFDWNNFTAEEKCDGSMILCRWYEKHLLINTAGSFGWGEVPYPITAGTSFRRLFLDTFAGCDRMDRDLTYVFELCTIQNKVVQTHKTPHVKLLSVFSGEEELSLFDRANRPLYLKVGVPDIYNVKSIGEGRLLMESKSQADPTFEGFVYRDENNNRLKDKCERYLLLHQAGTGEFNKQILIQRILEDDIGLIEERFPERMDYIRPLQKALDEVIEKVEGVYSQVKEIENQKEFALAIKHYKSSGILFTMRSKGIGPRQVLLENLSYAEKLLT